MMTKYRLLLDCLLQTLLLTVWILTVLFYTERILFFSVLFIILLLSWQVLHAWYVVHKHQDWHRRQYLRRLRRLIGYGLLTLAVGSGVALLSFGLLWSFGRFVGDVVGLGLGFGVLALALHYFGLSLKRLYQYYYRPRSFWDL